MAGASAREAAVRAVRDRLRPILMTSLAMIAGMVPLALGLGEGGEQSAPLGRAVIGGLAASTLATLLALPSVFALVMARADRQSASLHPFDPESRRYLGDREARLALAESDAAPWLRPDLASDPSLTPPQDA
jgi:hypothetical protein